MIEIKDYFDQGILFPVFQAERNMFIWKAIADEISFLEQQTKEVKKLYSFIQSSASTNFILYTAQLFDNPSTQYPTRCILSFLEKIKSRSSDFPRIIETTATVKLLTNIQAPIELINSVECENVSDFPLAFIAYFENKYKSSEIKANISKIKIVRDKNIAHNEAISSFLSVELQSVRQLLDFASEIISVFGMAYYNMIWIGGNTSLLTLNVEKDAFFIIDSITNLKGRG